jgi:hypothetical protein
LWHGIKGKTVGKTVAEHMGTSCINANLQWEYKTNNGTYKQETMELECGKANAILAPSQILPEMVGILTIPKGRFMALRLIITLITIRSIIISGKSRMDIRYFFYYSRVPFRVSTWVPKRR